MSVEVIVLTWSVVLEQVPPGWVKATTTKPNDTLW
jgi:hypothetical protein